MEVGIGLPATIPGTEGATVLAWARRADAGPFSSLAILDRLVFPNYEPLVTLAACAGATERIRLMTTVLLAPLRNPAMLAKATASLDALSNGRLTLGLGIGGREDDFLAAAVPLHERGKIFAQQLALMRRIWSGQPVSEAVGPVGPRPARAGGPEVLIGGYSPAAMRRVGRWADGFIAGGGAAASAGRLYQLALESWQAEQRPGQPRFVTCFYYGLGPDAAERAGAYIRAYYGFMGPAVENMVRALPTTPDAVRAAIEGYRAIGVDEVLAWPCIATLDQVDLLAEVIA